MPDDQIECLKMCSGCQIINIILITITIVIGLHQDKLIDLVKVLINSNYNDVVLATTLPSHSIDNRIKS